MWILMKRTSSVFGTDRCRFVYVDLAKFREVRKTNADFLVEGNENSLFSNRLEKTMRKIFYWAREAMFTWNLRVDRYVSNEEALRIVMASHIAHKLDVRRRSEAMYQMIKSPSLLAWADQFLAQHR